MQYCIAIHMYMCSVYMSIQLFIFKLHINTSSYVILFFMMIIVITFCSFFF